MKTVISSLALLIGCASAPPVSLSPKNYGLGLDPMVAEVADYVKNHAAAQREFNGNTDYVLFMDGDDRQIQLKYRDGGMAGPSSEDSLTLAVIRKNGPLESLFEDAGLNNFPSAPPYGNDTSTVPGLPVINSEQWTAEQRKQVQQEYLKVIDRVRWETRE